MSTVREADRLHDFRQIVYEPGLLGSYLLPLSCTTVSFMKVVGSAGLGYEFL